MAPCGIAHTIARAWPSSQTLFPRITKPTLPKAATPFLLETGLSHTAAKTYSKPITRHMCGVVSTWLLACNISSTLGTTVTAVLSSFHPSEFIWSSNLTSEAAEKLLGGAADTLRCLG